MTMTILLPQLKSNQKDLDLAVDAYGIAQYNAGLQMGRNVMIIYVRRHKDSLFSEDGELQIHLDILEDIEYEILNIP